jgi:anti-sigma factor (TIGR02949 family)
MTNPPDDLGPGCDQVRDLLDAYHDGELPASERAAVERHLTSCESCARDYDQLRQLSNTMREQMPPLAAPDLLRARVRAALRKPQPAPAEPGWPAIQRANWFQWIAAALMLTIGSSAVTVAVMHRSMPLGDRINSEVVAAHVRSLMANHLTDVASTDQHNVKPWFNGRVRFSPEVYRLDSAGFPLIGGRVDSVERIHVAVIVYGRRQHVISVFTWPAVVGPSPPADTTVLTERGYHALQWTHEGMQFWAVSDVNVPDLRTFVEQFQRAAAQ